MSDKNGKDQTVTKPTEEGHNGRVIDDATAEAIDLSARELMAQFTRGLSPVAMTTAVVDWLGHLVLSPGKMLSMSESALRNAAELAEFSIKSMNGQKTVDQPADRRMAGEKWQRFPFAAYAKGHELTRQWAHELTTGVEGVSAQHEAQVEFLARQIVELVSPANLPLTNPDVIDATIRERGANLLRGGKNLAGDFRMSREGEPRAGKEHLKVGEHIAVTPGKVVYQNELMELIQYAPATERVGAQPVLIVPAWIMKYYILDLSPTNSMVKYLVDRGKTVFIISWKNPGRENAEMAFEDYLHLGPMTALDIVQKITGSETVHGVGYCLGGTLLSIVAAYMAREGDQRLRSLSLFASQVDFTEGGEIRLFLGPSELTFLEAHMRRHGFLSIENMVAAFTSLRVSDLVYQPSVDRYLLGKDRELIDLMAWNEDGTRMPARMHSEYLRNCYLENKLAEARLNVDGRPVCVGDIGVPSFVLGTLTDHVAPWKSVYKIVRLTNNELTFVLTSGGHNAGIVSGPSHPRRRFQLARRVPGDKYIDPDRWVEQTPTIAGSWWPAWDAWLDERMDGEREPPDMGSPGKDLAPLRDAPGEYVFG